MKQQSSTSKPDEVTLQRVGVDHMLEAWLSYQLEAARFGERRHEKNLGLLQNLVHCGNWQEIAKLQQSWFKDVADYGEEWGRVTGVSFELALANIANISPLAHTLTSSVGGKN